MPMTQLTVGPFLVQRASALPQLDPASAAKPPLDGSDSDEQCLALLNQARDWKRASLPFSYLALGAFAVAALGSVAWVASVIDANSAGILGRLGFSSLMGGGSVGIIATGVAVALSSKGSAVADRALASQDA